MIYLKSGLEHTNNFYTTIISKESLKDNTKIILYRNKETALMSAIYKVYTLVKKAVYNIDIYKIKDTSIFNDVSKYHAKTCIEYKDIKDNLEFVETINSKLEVLVNLNRKQDAFKVNKNNYF